MLLREVARISKGEVRATSVLMDALNDVSIRLRESGRSPVAGTRCVAPARSSFRSATEERPPPDVSKLAEKPGLSVHSGGHKPSPAFSGMPYFAGFLERPRSSVGNPSLSAITLKHK